MKKHIYIALVAAFAVASFASAAELPPGKWWRNPQIAQRLDLNAGQQARLDDMQGRRNIVPQGGVVWVFALEDE